MCALPGTNSHLIVQEAPGSAEDNYDYMVLQKTAFVASVKILLPQASQLCQKDARVLLRRVAQKHEVQPSNFDAHKSVRVFASVKINLRGRRGEFCALEIWNSRSGFLGHKTIIKIGRGLIKTLAGVCVAFFAN